MAQKVKDLFGGNKAKPVKNKSNMKWVDKMGKRSSFESEMIKRSPSLKRK